MNILKYSLAVVLLLSVNTQAQNWLWTKSPGSIGVNPNASYRGVDGAIVKTGPDNSVYTAAINWSNNLSIGSDLFYDTIISVNFLGSNPQAILTKYDLAGNVIWAKASSNSTALPIDIITDPSGNVYLFGGFTGDSLRFDFFFAVNPKFNNEPFGIAPCNYFLLKLNPSGNIIWMRTGSLSFSNLEFHLTYQGGIALDGNNNIYIASSFKDTAAVIGKDTLTNANVRYDDIFMAKYDPSGNPVWAKSYGGEFDDEVNGIVVRNGRIYIAGRFQSSQMIIGNDTLSYIGPMIGSGSTTSNLYMAAFDTSGTPIWAKGSTSNSFPNSLKMDASGNLYVGGAVSFVPYMTLGSDSVVIPTLGAAGFLASVDTNGNTRWLKVFPQKIPYPGEDNMVYGITMDACNNIWITGGIDHTGGIVLDTDTFIFHTNIMEHMFIAELNDSGRVLNAYSMLSGNYGRAGLAADSFGNIYLSSYYSIDPFSIGSDVMHLYNGDYDNVFLAKFAQGNGSDMLSSANFCTDSTTIISGPKGYEKYYWNTGAISDSIPVNKGGSYIFYGYSGCELKVTDNVFVREIALTPSVTNIVRCWASDNKILLDPGAPNGSSTIWNTNLSTPSITVADAGAYWVNITIGNCSVTDTFNVGEYSCNCIVSLPGAFTPNGDGKNDFFGAVNQSGCTIEDFNLSIYNRWGNLVFKSNDPAYLWDGTYHGISVDMDTYMYTMEYKTNYDRYAHRVKGSVILVR